MHSSKQEKWTLWALQADQDFEEILERISEARGRAKLEVIDRRRGCVILIETVDSKAGRR